MVTSGGDGDVIVGGQGGLGGGGTSYGVVVNAAGVLTAGGMGGVTVLGIGGLVAGNNNYGVFVSDPMSQITSNGGQVMVTGTGGGAVGSASADNIGLDIANGGLVGAAGNGLVIIQGSGGRGGGDSNTGIFVTGANSQITSAGGAVQVAGTGGVPAMPLMASISKRLER